VVLVAVELLQLRFEVLADLPHDLLAPGQHLAGECAAAVLVTKTKWTWRL
jgi:hypothetical protein